MRVTLPEEVRMRGDDRQQAAMWSHISPDQRVPRTTPCGRSGPWSTAYCGSCRRGSSALYAKRGRPSIAPEKRLRALVLQLLYSVRSERLLREQQPFAPHRVQELEHKGSQPFLRGDRGAAPFGV